MNPYLAQFHKLRCRGDVLNVVNPIGNAAAKEITESMAIIKRIKPIALAKPMQNRLWDLCAGNALTSVLAVHLLPIQSAVAVDLRERKRNWGSAKRFEYVQADIHELTTTAFCSIDIIISVHPCGGLAERVIELYMRSAARHLIMMPCCHGSFKKNQFLIENLGTYATWCLHLAGLCGGNLAKDENCLSPKNIVVTASKQTGEITNGRLEHKR